LEGFRRSLCFQFVRILSSRPNFKVVATCRNPDAATELTSLSNVDVLKVDVSQNDDIEAAAKVVRQKFGKVDILINSAGILHPSG
jgi:NAD(P)-dependent dehydrogenase (short-subunit alcohol dehydrogenase family)